MNSREEAKKVRLVEHQHGKLLRLETPGTYSMDTAVDLLGFLESELSADIHDTGWKRGFGLKVAIPLLIQLESLEVELVTDGSEVVMRRVGGSSDEFADLCELIEEQYCHG